MDPIFISTFVIVGLIVIWNLIPILTVLSFKEAPIEHRWKAVLNFLFVAFPKGLLAFIPEMIAPIVVPIALIFTKREDDKLPWLFTWWDNDVSINGDVEEYWDPSYEGTTYYAKAHPRSFWARYVWLGWRNRASRLAQMLGAKIKPTDVKEFWGDAQTSRAHEGTVLFHTNGTYQMYLTRRIFGNWCFRMNYGHKVWGPESTYRPRAMVVTIAASVLSWKR